MLNNLPRLPYAIGDKRTIDLVYNMSEEEGLEIIPFPLDIYARRAKTNVIM